MLVTQVVVAVHMIPLTARLLAVKPAQVAVDLVDGRLKLTPTS